MQLAQSSFFVELGSEMDAIIERFHKEEVPPTLLRDLIRLNWRLSREKVKVVSSTVFSLSSLCLPAHLVEGTNFFQNLVGVGVLLLLFSLYYVSYSMWMSFALR